MTGGKENFQARSRGNGKKKRSLMACEAHLSDPCEAPKASSTAFQMDQICALVLTLQQLPTLRFPRASAVMQKIVILFWHENMQHCLAAGNGASL